MIQSAGALIVRADDESCHDPGCRDDQQQHQRLDEQVLGLGRMHEQDEQHRQRDKIGQTKALPDFFGNRWTAERVHLRSSMVIGPSRRPWVNWSTMALPEFIRSAARPCQTSLP